MPFSRNRGLKRSAWLTSSMMMGLPCATTLPARPFPTGMRTPSSTSSSRPWAAQATSSSPSFRSSRMATVSTRSTSRMRLRDSESTSSIDRWASAESVIRCNASSCLLSASASRRASLARARALTRSSSLFLRSMNCPIWLPMAARVSSVVVSASWISRLKSSTTPITSSRTSMGKLNAECRFARAATGEREKLSSVARSGTQIGFCPAQTFPGSPMPGVK